MTDHLETRLSPLANQLRTGQLKLSDYLAKLEPYFEAENKRVLAFLPEENRFERLQREAAQLEARYPYPQSRPPLYGVPVGVKDIFRVDGFPTRAGSNLPPEDLAGPEAKSVTQLKEAGALILGKTVTTEFAYFGPGPTRNPHNTAHTPGGSSSGSAAGVAAGLSPLALGTQTIGSVVRPAAFCGTFGYKPSAGRISTRNVIPLSPSLDHVGFFTQDVDGLILAASVLCKNWQPDATAVEGLPVLGVPTGPYLEKVTDEGIAHFEATQEKLRQAGYTIKAVAAMTDFDEIVVWHNDLMAGQVAQVHQEWFERYHDLYHPKTAALIERGHQVAPEAIKVYQAERQWLAQELRKVMTGHGIEVWISPPATGPAPAGLSSTGDPVMNLPWTYAGLPAINLPAGFAKNGLPLGLQITTDCGQDEKLMGWAKSLAETVAP